MGRLPNSAIAIAKEDQEMTRLGIEVASASCRVAADIENLDEQQWWLSAAITTQGSVSPLQSTYLSMPTALSIPHLLPSP